MLSPKMGLIIARGRLILGNLLLGRPQKIRSAEPPSIWKRSYQTPKTTQRLTQMILRNIKNLPSSLKLYFPGSLQSQFVYSKLLLLTEIVQAPVFPSWLTCFTSPGFWSKPKLASLHQNLSFCKSFQLVGNSSFKKVSWLCTGSLGRMLIINWLPQSRLCVGAILGRFARPTMKILDDWKPIPLLKQH